MRRNSIINDICSDELLESLKKYNYEVVNKLPLSEYDLIKYYEKYSDPVVTAARLITNNNVFTLGNEVRAMLGHLADYRQNPKYRKNLKDAYGHFRRLNVDAFKIICDEADKALFKYMDKNKRYDFSDVNYAFLKEYAKKYFAAKKLYLDAQISEKTGSDRASGNIMQKYHLASLAYAELLSYKYHNSSGIRGKVIRTRISTVACIVFDVIVAIIGFITG